MSALHYANIGGSTDAALTDVATTFSSPALAALPAIASPDYVFICVDPDGIGGEPEWMKITAYTSAAATCTVERAAESSTARAHASSVDWVHTLAPSEADAAVQPLLHVRDEKASGTASGTFTSGAWQTRTLNTVKTNEISGAALAANAISLPAGTYEVDAFGMAFYCDHNRLRLYDVTAAAEVLIGPNVRMEVGAGNTAGAVNMPATVRGRFTLSVTSEVRLEHRCLTTRTTDGFGQASSMGTEVYADLMIRKVG